MAERSVLAQIENTNGGKIGFQEANEYYSDSNDLLFASNICKFFFFNNLQMIYYPTNDIMSVLGLIAIIVYKIAVYFFLCL